MDAAKLIEFLCPALVVPLGIPFMMILVDQWRFPRRSMARRLILLLALHTLYCAAVVRLFGLSDLAGAMAAIVPVAVCWFLYAWVTRYRDGRFLFTVVTVGLLSTVTNVLSTLCFPYGTLPWLWVKLSLTLALSLVLWRCCRRPFLCILHSAERGWVRLTLIPLTLWASLLLVYDLPTTVGLGQPNTCVALLLTAAVPLIYLSLNHFLRALTDQYRTSRDAAVLRAQMESLQRQFEQIQAGERQNSIFRHDLRHFVHLLEGRLQCGDSAGARQILASMERTLAVLSPTAAHRDYTGNPLLDTVFSISAARAEAAGVDFSVRMALPDPLPADVTELAVVVSNALENAFNACMTLPAGAERAIRVFDSGGGGQFFLSIENTFQGSPNFSPETGLPLPTKPGHGYGTQSIAAFAQKYGAQLRCAADGDWFSLQLLL